jgi:hypothetical protein
MTVACVNPACAEHGVPKNVPFELAPGETVECGWCNEPCEEVAPAPEPEPKAEQLPA